MRIPDYLPDVLNDTLLSSRPRVASQTLQGHENNGSSRLASATMIWIDHWVISVPADLEHRIRKYTNSQFEFFARNAVGNHRQFGKLRRTTVYSLFPPEPTLP